MIESFADRKTEQAFYGIATKGFSADLRKVARRKLRMVHRATGHQDLMVPPANRLEALKGDRSGQHSIRVNDQFRICFRWRDQSAFEVEFVDYH